MRKSEWIERKAVNCIEEIFLQHDLYHLLDVNDKTEFIDGYVYVENDIKKLSGIDIGKVELQIKGRTNNKRVDVKKTFIDYCKTCMYPVVVFLVNFNSDKEIEGIYYKYMDRDTCNKFDKEDNIKYTLVFKESDRINIKELIKDINSIQYKHWNRLILSLKNSDNKIINIEMYSFVNSIIRSVNGFLFTPLKKYMNSKFDKLERFAIVYCSEDNIGISYSIIPIFKDSICSDIIEVTDTNSMWKMGITRIHSTGVSFDVNCSNNFIIQILKKTIIPSIINQRLFCTYNKEMAIRSYIYTFNRIFSLELEKLSFGKIDKSSCIAKYDEDLKKILRVEKREYSRSVIERIVDLNIQLITEKLKADIDLYSKYNDENTNYCFYSECNDNKYKVNINKGDYSIQTIKESKFFLMKELLNFINEDYVLNLEHCLELDCFFKTLGEAKKYVKLKYDCICDFSNKYLNIQPIKYKWNVFVNNKRNLEFLRGTETTEIYFSNTYTNEQDEKIKENSDNYDFNNSLRYIRSCVIPSSRNHVIGCDPLAEDIYESIIEIINEEIDRYFKNDVY